MEANGLRHMYVHVIRANTHVAIRTYYNVHAIINVRAIKHTVHANTSID